MIITIKNDDGESVFDVSKIEDEQNKANANVTISKIGTLNVLVEALNFASQGHQNNLETILKDSPEAIVESEEEVETSEASDTDLESVEETEEVAIAEAVGEDDPAESLRAQASEWLGSVLQYVPKDEK